MPGTMRGVYTNLTEIRRKVFAGVARIAYEQGEDSEGDLQRLPYEIVPGEIATYRESVFLERAIVSERIRLAMGLPLQGVDKPQSMTDGIIDASVPETYYQPPLINVIKFACNACKDNVYEVSNACQGCLAHPCREICPKGAITFKDKKAYIDQEKCVHCGMCAKTCPYHAIHHFERPCAVACGMGAIGSDEHGHAKIDYEKCVSCGQCLVNCPFGAIADKSQIFQVIMAINAGDEVIAEVAPAFVGQFGGKGNVDKLREAFKQLGFSGMEEVALGADLCTIQESEDFLEEVPEKIPFMGTSLLPGMVGHGKEGVPQERRLHQHGPYAHDAHRAPYPQAAPQRKDRLCRAVLRKEARGHARVRALRGRLRPHLRGDGGHDERQGDRTTPSSRARAATSTWPPPTAAGSPWRAAWRRPWPTPFTSATPSARSRRPTPRASTSAAS